MKIDPRRQAIKTAQSIVNDDIRHHLRDRKAHKATKCVREEGANIEALRALAANLRNVAARIDAKAAEMAGHHTEGRTARLSIAKQEAERLVDEARAYLHKGK